MKSFKEYLQEKHYSESTIRIYQNGVTDFLDWISLHQYSIENVRYADLMSFIKHRQNKGVTKTSIQNELLSIRHYFNHLVKEKQVKSNPAQGVYIRGIARRLPHDLVEHKELVNLYDTYPVSNPRDQRNKVILGLLIFQAVTIEELELLKAEHINLREGKIKIPGTDRTNERVLKLEASQVYDLQEYISKTRARIINGPKVSEPEKIAQLIIGMQGGSTLSGEVLWMMRRLKHELKHEQVKQASQIRASTIAEWTRIHDVRVVQYMAGHKYVSTTEKYQGSHLEDLKEQLKKYHPLADDVAGKSTPRTK